MHLLFQQWRSLLLGEWSESGDSSYLERLKMTVAGHGNDCRESPATVECDSLLLVSDASEHFTFSQSDSLLLLMHVTLVSLLLSKCDSLVGL